MHVLVVQEVGSIQGPNPACQNLNAPSILTQLRMKEVSRFSAQEQLDRYHNNLSVLRSSPLLMFLTTLNVMSYYR